MNSEVLNTTELTVNGINPTLRSEGNIFMGDGGINTEGGQIGPPVKGPDHSVSPKPANQDQLRGEWQNAFSPRDQQNPDTRAAIEAAIGLGIGPQRVTSKGKTEQRAEQVVENASLEDSKHSQTTVDLLAKDKLTAEEREELFRDHSERLSKAQKLLGEGKLTYEQKIAILKAHYSSYGEKGRDGGPAGIYNLTQEQIAKEARILKEAGFTKEQRRMIMESGLAAAAPPPPQPDYRAERNTKISDLTGIDFGNPELNQIAAQLISVHNTSGPEGITSENLIGILNQWGKARDEGRLRSTPADRFVDFSKRVGEIGNLDGLMRGMGRAEEGFWTEYEYFSHEIAEARRVGDLVRISVLENQSRDAVRKFVGQVNPFETGLRDHTLKIIVNDEEALERLAFRIVGAPLQSETGDYSLGFYGQINIDAMTNLLQTLSENPTLEPNSATRSLRERQLKTTSWIKEGVRIMHELNKFVVTGKLDQAAQVAESLLPEYSHILQRRKGVAGIQRRLEAALGNRVSKEGYLTTRGYQEIMGGVKNDKTGKLEVNQESSVFQTFKNQVEYWNQFPDLAPNDLQEYLGMEEWELKLAFNLGRNLYNNQQRTAEWGSHGAPPEGKRSIESFPQESFSRIYNVGRWLLERYTIGKNRGGLRWFEMLMDAMQRGRSREGYGKMMLEKIRGDEVRHFELPTMTGVRGWWASWRATGGILRQVDNVYEPRGKVEHFSVYNEVSNGNMVEIFDATAGAASSDTKIGLLLDTEAVRFKDADGNVIKFDDKEVTDDMKADFYRSIFYKPETAELRDDLQAGLGTIYRVGLDASSHDNNSPKTKQVKEEIRALIWERTARENPLAVIPYLHGLKYSKDHEKVTIRDSATGTPVRVDVNKSGRGRNPLRKEGLVNIYDVPGLDWQAFESKLTFLNEIRLAKIRGFQEADGSHTARTAAPDLSYTLQDAIDHVRNITGGYDTANPNNPNNLVNLSQDEITLLAEIAREGSLASRDMANVKFAFIPFLNDVILEKADYDAPGSEAFQRHFRDLAQFNASNSALAEAMDNLGLITKYEQMVDFISKFTKGITGVHGDEVSKGKAHPVIETTIAFFRRGENVIDKKEDFVGEEELPRRKRIARWIKQQDEFHEITQKLYKPNSIAQQYYNVEVLALDRGQTHEAIQKLVGAGFMGPEEEKAIRKRFGGILNFITRMILESIQRGFKAGAIIAGAELFKRSFNPKGAVE